ncbi:hypothetical protein COY28_04385 [Candidatus Woesearchaeota archaeon CG_4_10_14_0_2_um_filter_57_5]|nr:MAG: hypothetical protein COY28_04385 [Candidatus Woesearchaeota archaeon CG_4_10_14_0_2_um_filter_57_5]
MSESAIETVNAPKAKIQSVNQTDKTHIMSGTASGNCTFHQAGHCAIYANRPKACRSFPFEAHWNNSTLLIDVKWSCPSVQRLFPLQQTETSGQNQTIIEPASIGNDPNAPSSPIGFADMSIADIVIPQDHHTAVPTEQEQNSLKFCIPAIASNISRAGDFIALMQALLLREGLSATAALAKAPDSLQRLRPSPILLCVPEEQPLTAKDASGCYRIYTDDHMLILEDRAEYDMRLLVPLSEQSPSDTGHVPIGQEIQAWTASYLLHKSKRAGFQLRASTMPGSYLPAALELLRRELLAWQVLFPAVTKKNNHHAPTIHDLHEVVLMTDT